MSPRTVAVYGATGNIGAPLIKALYPRHQAGEIKLVVIHRAGSKLDNVPAEIERRVLDYASATEAQVHDALRDVNILLAATYNTTREQDAAFAKALSTLPNKASFRFFFSDYSVRWTPEEEATITESKFFIRNTARDLGVKVTGIQNGLFEDFFFFPGFLGPDARANKLTTAPGAFDKSFPITSTPWLAEAVAQIVSETPLDEIKDQYTVVEQWVTGPELVAAFTKVHGEKPKLAEFTPEEDAARIAGGGPPALGVLLGKKWASGVFPPGNEFTPKGLTARTIDQAVETNSK
ncbi:uncharacterized protein LOC62_05G007484 [Vanrija pseudolonga]|uniref:NmrA-like domain-containing protein n=1 Tax=Vanrija pseudolonga TaxID=143232 RepID=A0AAF1BKH0_9TREE|nr:hypothetical protein LOC62_05G007484 [Vanrija pseudolonga]